MANRIVTFLGVFFMVGCAPPLKPRTGFAPLKSRGAGTLYVYVSDGSAGGVRRVDLARGEIHRQALTAHSDAQLRWNPFDSTLGVLNRLAAPHFTQASADLITPRQFGFAPGSNPQDVCYLGGGEAYFSFYASNQVERRRLDTGAVTAVIDLKDYADADGFAEPTYFEKVGGQVVVSLQNIDMRNYQPPRGSGYLVRLDPWTDTAHAVPLRYPNPYARLDSFGGEVFVAESGILAARGEDGGGIERFQTQPLQSQGWVISEQALGGDILSFALTGADSGFAVAGSVDTRLVRFAAGKVETVVDAKGYRFPAVLWDAARGLIWVADREENNPGIRVFEESGKELPEHFVALEFPPSGMVLAP